MTPHIRRLLSRSVCQNFLNRSGKLHFHASIGTLVYFRIDTAVKNADSKEKTMKENLQLRLEFTLHN